MRLLLGLLVLMRTPVASDPVQDLTRLEQRLIDALAHSDVRTIDGLWSDDLIFIGADGKPSTKLERLSRMKAPAAPSVDGHGKLNFFEQAPV